MSFFKRLFRRLSSADEAVRGNDPETLDDAEVNEVSDAQLAPATPAAASPEEQQLARMVDSLDRGETIDASRVMEMISQLDASGARQSSVDYLRRLCRRLSGEHGLRLQLAERLYDLKLFPEALEHLRELQDSPGVSKQANFLLGDYHDRELNHAAALRHYEAILAEDFTFPRARARADRIRDQLDRPVATSAPTILGADDLGPSSRFILQREVGRGGGGTVYLAQDQALDRVVALKVLHPHVTQRQEAKAHLFCEARIAASLNHPQIVTVYDLDESLNLVVMEFCGGGALASRIADTPQSHGQAMQRLAEVTDVLDLVHRCGVVHRDLKPANLLLRATDDSARLVLTDFGIANAGPDGSTPAGGEGSLAYMAPELRHGQSVDPRADLYACGVILLEMLLGRRPLTHQQAIQGVLIQEVDDVWSELSSRLPRALAGAIEALCRSLVAPDVDDRPATAGEVHQRSRQLVRDAEAQELGQELGQELERRAGPAPRPDRVERWLRDQLALPEYER